jgi:serine/threonine-protein kinase
MGIVYRATQLALARPVALKLVASHYAAAEDFRARFKREWETAAAIDHPNVIPVYEAGEAQGHLFLAMRYVEGVDLANLIAGEVSLDMSRSIRMIAQVASALDAAHARGLVHRDVKPANIYLCRLGREHDFVKVLDFGLVKYDRDHSVMDTIKTSTELTTGTPAYMAPEMAGGEAVDRRADLYALGCVAYWLLTAQLVFEADNPLRMLIQHIQAEPVPPGLRAGIVLPARLERLIMRCLVKDPAGRPSSADEILAELELVELDRPWDQSRARAWWETNGGRGVPVPVATEARTMAVRT